MHCPSGSIWTRPVTLQYQDPSTIQSLCTSTVNWTLTIHTVRILYKSQHTGARTDSAKCEITDRSSLGPRICRPDLNWAPSWLLAHSSSPTNGINDHLTASFSRLVRRRYVRLLVRDLLLTNSVPILQAMPPRFWHLVPSTVSRHRCEQSELRNSKIEAASLGSLLPED